MAAGALAGALWLLRTFIWTALGSALEENDGPRKAEVIVVLGGDDSGNRILKAAELARAGYAPYVLVSGPKSLLGHESDSTIEYARRQGFPNSLFEPLPNDSDSTRSEATLIGAYLRARGIRKILLVTSNFHTRRAAGLVRHENPGLQVDVVPAPDPYFTPGGWWKSRNGQKTFLIEWMKTVATWAGM
ncbi:MAG: YdcF family protein [Acidobacteriaceae bacterium]|nr:YdcF family protein [Acidobacteriaceae bacterium]